MTEAQKRAKEKYRAKVSRLTIEFYPTDADLIEHIEKQPKKQTYIKDLIREDIRRQNLTLNIDGSVIAEKVKDLFEK